MKTKLLPDVVEIKPDDKRYKRIKEVFAEFKRLSLDKLREEREQKWKENENIYTAYVPVDQLDEMAVKKRERGEQDYATVAIPYSYAMLLAAHTYYTSVFLSRSPILQIQGRHGEAQDSETAMESLLNYQLSVGNNIVPLYIWLMDIGKYSHGVLGQYWDKEVVTMTKRTMKQKMFGDLPIPDTEEMVEEVLEFPGYEGIRLYNIRPMDFMTDPRVPLLRFQDGEYCIMKEKLSWHKFIACAALGKYYNVEEVRKTGKAEPESDASLGEFANMPESGSPSTIAGKFRVDTVNLHELYWSVVPSELGIGKNNRPEKWVFTFANDVLVSAQPLGLLHGKFPFDVIPFETEGYNVYNRSMLEILTPLNKTMEWLFNTHFFNVRAALNNTFAVDPSKVVLKDFENRGPGKLIRLKPAAYGQDIRSFISQFPVSDATGNHLRDSNVVAELCQRITGVSDNVMGAVNAGGRKTATEVRQSTSMGINRLKTNVEWFSVAGFTPMTQKLISTTQQFYATEQKLLVVGDQASWLGQYIDVNPQKIAGAYDFEPVDGTMPVDRFAQANLWQNLLTNMGRVPGMLEQFDMSKLFAFVAQLGGLKNVNRFKVQVQPDAVLQAQAQQGNMIPVPMGGAPSPGRANMNEPGQIPGLGPTA